MPSATEIAIRNQLLSSSPATNLCTPNLIASPLANVTANAATTTSPHAPGPIAKPSKVSSAPISATTPMLAARCPKSPPGSLIPTYSAPNTTVTT